jgi:hypothetical protein
MGEISVASSAASIKSRRSGTEFSLRASSEADSPVIVVIGKEILKEGILDRERLYLRSFR